MATEPGLCARISVEVTEADTAISLHSGDVEVLGTPRIVALAEEAAVAALEGHLAPGETSVGMRVQLDHLAPALVGAEIAVDATLERAEGRRLTFTVSVSDDRGLIAAGKVTRVVVDREKFMEKAR